MQVYEENCINNAPLKYQLYSYLPKGRKQIPLQVGGTSWAHYLNARTACHLRHLDM